MAISGSEVNLVKPLKSTVLMWPMCRAYAGMTQPAIQSNNSVDLDIIGGADSSGHPGRAVDVETFNMANDIQ